MPEPSRRAGLTLLAVVAWMAGAAVATALTMGAVSLIDAGLFDGSTTPLSEADVADALAAERASAAPTPSGTTTGSPTSSEPAASPTPSPTHSISAPTAQQPPTAPTASGPSAAVAFSRAGNSVVARCESAAAQVLSWSPAQGYRVSAGVKQHGDEAEVEFESEDHRVRIRVACAGDQPTARIEED